MKQGFRLAAATFASTLCLVLFGQCRRQEVLRPDALPAAADSARVVAQPRPAPPATVPLATVDAATNAVSKAPSVGNWLDGNIYRFRLEAIRLCTPPPVAAGSVRIGFLVRVSSQIDELLVAPRDLKLESGGVILDSAVLPKVPSGCTPLLAPKSLRAGKTAEGVVVFDIPPGFDQGHGPVTLTYQPTRWGGARRVEAVLPPGALARPAGI